jgi:hypothetical protein
MDEIGLMMGGAHGMEVAHHGHWRGPFAPSPLRGSPPRIFVNR